MKYGVVLMTLIASILSIASLGLASAYLGFSSTPAYAADGCYTCVEQRALLIEKAMPDIIYRQNYLFGCVGCADTTIYRTIHLTAPRPETQYSFVEGICPWYRGFG